MVKAREPSQFNMLKTQADQSSQSYSIQSINAALGLRRRLYPTMFSVDTKFAWQKRSEAFLA